MPLPNNCSTLIKELKGKVSIFAQSQNDRLGHVIFDALNVLQIIESKGITSSISLDMANNALRSSGSYALSQETVESDSIRTLTYGLCEALSQTVSSLSRSPSEDGANSNSTSPLLNQPESNDSQPNDVSNSVVSTGTPTLICTQQATDSVVLNAIETPKNMTLPIPYNSCKARQEGVATSHVVPPAENSFAIENEAANVLKVGQSQSESSVIQCSSCIDPSEYVGFRQKLKRNTVGAPTYAEDDDDDEPFLFFTASNNDNDKLACFQCGKLFTTAHRLKCHERTHSYLRCTLCSRSMKDKNTLEVHMQRLHSNNEAGNIEADVNEPLIKKNRSTDEDGAHHIAIESGIKAESD